MRNIEEVLGSTLLKSVLKPFQDEPNLVFLNTPSMYKKLKTGISHGVKYFHHFWLPMKTTFMRNEIV